MKRYRPLLSVLLGALLVMGQAVAQESAPPVEPKAPVGKQEEVKKPRPLKNTVAVILAGAAAGSAVGAGISKDKTKGAIFGAIAGGVAAVIYDRVTKDDPPGKF